MALASPNRAFSIAHSLLWSLLYMLGQSPDLDVAFEEEADREAARNLMDLLAAPGND